MILTVVALRLVTVMQEIDIFVPDHERQKINPRFPHYDSEPEERRVPRPQRVLDATHIQQVGTDDDMHTRRQETH